MVSDDGGSAVRVAMKRGRLVLRLEHDDKHLNEHRVDDHRDERFDHCKEQIEVRRLVGEHGGEEGACLGF